MIRVETMRTKPHQRTLHELDVKEETGQIPSGALLLERTLGCLQIAPMDLVIVPGGPRLEEPFWRICADPGILVSAPRQALCRNGRLAVGSGSEAR